MTSGEHPEDDLDGQRRDPASPLPWALGLVGVLLPLLAVGTGPWARGLRTGGGDAFTIAVALLSGLVAASVGVLLRRSTRWGAYLGLGMGAGTTFALLIAGIMPTGWIGGPLVLMAAMACAGALVAFAAGIFAEHTGFLAARPGSLLAAIGRVRVVVTTMGSIVGAAWLVAQVGVPSHGRSIVATLAVITMAIAVGHDRGHIRRLREVASRVGPSVLDPVVSHTVVDLGVGTDRWLAERTTEEQGAGGPYRDDPGRVVRVVRGSVARALSRARRAARTDLGQLGLAVLALAHLLIGDANAREEQEHAAAAVEAPPIPAHPAAPAPVRAGAWYPQQTPILVDLDDDGVEDVVSLRWDSSNERRALFVAAHDGATFRALWATEPTPSQWMSARTQLVRSGDTLFLTDSEKKVHVFELSTGARTRPAVLVESDGGPCLDASEVAGLWFDTQGPGGTRIDRHRSVEMERPASCLQVARAFVSPLGEYHPACIDRVRSEDEPPFRAMLHRSGEVGLGLWRTDAGEHRVLGYDPTSCGTRWRASLGFDGSALHHDPQIHHAMDGGRLFTLYQLASGGWHLGVRDATTGAMPWYRALPRADRGSNLQQLFLGKGRVYVARSWHLDVFRRDDGTHLGAM